MTRLCSMHHCMNDAEHTVAFPESRYEHSREHFCPDCLKAIGLAWRASAYRVVDVHWEVRPRTGERGRTTIVSPTRGYALTMYLTRKKDSGARLFRVTTYRKPTP